MYDILLIGYGWFRGIPEGETNNAELVARALDGDTIPFRRADGSEICARIHGLVVPVSWEKAFPPVRTAIDTLHPGVVLALGTDACAAALRPEPWGVNWRRGRDADSENPEQACELDGPILPGESDALCGTLPYEAITRAILQAGIPAQLGGLIPAPENAPLPVACTAGLYLCNDMTYRLAHLAAQRKGLRAGFLHLPTQPAYACARRLRKLAVLPQAEADALLHEPMPASLPLECLIAGVRAALGACLA